MLIYLQLYEYRSLGEGESSVSSKKNRAFLLLRRRERASVPLAAQGAAQSWPFSLRVPLAYVLELQAHSLVS